MRRISLRTACRRLPTAALIPLLALSWLASCGPPSNSGQIPPRPNAAESPGASTVEEMALQTVPLPLMGVWEQVKDLPWGTIAFDSPQRMTVGKSLKIVAEISPQTTPAEMRARLEGEKLREFESLQLSDRMQARLTGAGFSITAITPETQAVSPGGNTRWEWDVEARDGGERTLHLAVNALIQVEGKTTPFVVRTLSREIKVRVTWSSRIAGFAQKNWSWLWATILVPVGGFFWNRWRKRHRGAQPDDSSPSRQA